MTARQKEIFPNIFTSQCAIYPPVNTIQHAIAKTWCWITTGSHISFLPEQLASLVSLLWICLCQVLNLQLSFWIFMMFLMTQPSTCVGPYKRTVNPLIIPRVPEVQFQLHTRWGCTLFPLINIQSTYFFQINILYFSCHCYKFKRLMTSWIILPTSKLAV